MSPMSPTMTNSMGPATISAGGDGKSRRLPEERKGTNPMATRRKNQASKGSSGKVSAKDKEFDKLLRLASVSQKTARKKGSSAA